MVCKASELTIILGSPASGKTTLARRLAADLSLPVLSKDDVKESLFDALGVGDRDWSRRLSEASFGALLRVGETQLAAGLSCLLEGNWSSTHEASIRALLLKTGARAAQVWCAAEPGEIVRRFTLRIRHPGHLDPLIPREDVERAAHRPPAFLDVHGPRWVFRSDSPGAYAELKDSLKSWRL
jgi:predicted kinase